MVFKILTLYPWRPFQVSAAPPKLNANTFMQGLAAFKCANIVNGEACGPPWSILDRHFDVYSEAEWSIKAETYIFPGTAPFCPFNHISYHCWVVSGHRCVRPGKYHKILEMLLN